MSKHSIKDYKRIDSGKVLNRKFDVYFGDRRLFSVEAYSGNCCGASTIEAVNGYATEEQLCAGLKFVSNLHGHIDQDSAEDAHFMWHLKSFFFFGSDQAEYKRISKAFGMEEVFRFPSRSEPGHDVVQYFVDFGESVNTDDE